MERSEVGEIRLRHGAGRLEGEVDPVAPRGDVGPKLGIAIETRRHPFRHHRPGRLGVGIGGAETIVTFACSTGERYLSTPLYNIVGMNGSAASNDFTI